MLFVVGSYLARRRQVVRHRVELPPRAHKVVVDLYALCSLFCLAVVRSVTRAASSAGRRARPQQHALSHGSIRSLVGYSRPALAKILIGDATNPVCESVFRSRGHDVDVRPGLSKVSSRRLHGAQEEPRHRYIYRLMLTGAYDSEGSTIMAMYLVRPWGVSWSCHSLPHMNSLRRWRYLLGKTQNFSPASPFTGHQVENTREGVYKGRASPQDSMRYQGP